MNCSIGFWCVAVRWNRWPTQFLWNNFGISLTLSHTQTQMARMNHEFFMSFGRHSSFGIEIVEKHSITFEWCGSMSVWWSCGKIMIYLIVDKSIWDLQFDDDCAGGLCVFTNDEIPPYDRTAFESHKLCIVIVEFFVEYESFFENKNRIHIIGERQKAEERERERRYHGAHANVNPNNYNLFSFFFDLIFLVQ